jgi:hypothetical protein
LRFDLRICSCIDRRERARCEAVAATQVKVVPSQV